MGSCTRVPSEPVHAALFTAPPSNITPLTRIPRSCPKKDTSNLRKELAESQLQKEREERNIFQDQPSGRLGGRQAEWRTALEAFKAGWRMPERRSPVLISQREGILSSPEQLKELADLQEVPPVTRTTWTTLGATKEDRNKDDQEEEVDVCDITESQFRVLSERVETTENWERLVWLHDAPRFVYVVVGLKENTDPSKVT